MKQRLEVWRRFGLRLSRRAEEPLKIYKLVVKTLTVTLSAPAALHPGRLGS